MKRDHSAAIEALAASSGVPVLECLEFFLERAAIREFEGGMSRDEAEAAALEDARLWVRLWVQVKGELGPQMKLRGAS